MVRRMPLVDATAGLRAHAPPQRRELTMTYRIRPTLPLLPLSLFAVAACASGADDLLQQEQQQVEATRCDPTAPSDDDCMTGESPAVDDDGEPVVDPTEPPPAEPEPLDPACVMVRGSEAHEDYCDAHADVAACDADPACYFQQSLPSYGGSFCAAIDDGPAEIYDQSCEGAPTAFHPDSSGQLVITELMRDPQALNDADGEWIEVWNPSQVGWNLAGCELRDEGSNRHVFGDFPIDAETSVVLARSASPGFTPDYVYGGDMFLNNSGADEVIIACDDVEIAAVRYDSSWGFAPGHSFELGLYFQTEHENDSPDNWCVPSETYGSGDHGTPGFVGQCSEAL